MLDIQSLRDKYSPKPRIFGDSNSTWTPAGAKDVKALCDEVEELRRELKILRGKYDEELQGVREGNRW